MSKIINLIRQSRLLASNIPGTLYSLLPLPGINRPTFIIGCGRSGTTILGTALSKHREVTYLNEPRHLWFSAYPITDIWSSKADSRNGRLVLTAADANERRSEKMSRLFRFETLLSRRPVLIEKLPINNFRLSFIRQIFPDARFIHIYRNGLEVARSIEKFSKKGDWFGDNYYKWNRLLEHALSMDETRHLPELCSSDYFKGLLEWRLSTEAAVNFLCSISDDAFIELSYDELIGDPASAISQVLKFIGIDDDQKVKNFVSENIKRRTGKLGQNNITEKEALLGGRLLPFSMDEEEGLATRCP